MIVSAGQYFLSEPLTFTADRFGSIGCALSMTCPDDEPASFCAWVPVTGFTETTVNGVKAWEAPLPTVRGEQLDAHQFFSASGERLPRPRFPETGFLRVAGVPGISNFKEAERTTPMGALIYGRDEIPHLTHIEDIQMVMYHYWNDERLSLFGVDEETRTLTFTSDTSMAFHDSGAAAPYFLDNVYEALDAPGEVYSDTEAGKLYYIPRDGETRENFVIYASDLDKLLVIDGIHAGEGETVLSFENIAFVGSDWKVEARRSSQAANDIEAAVTLNDIRGVVFRNCDFLHIGNTAVELFKSVSDITFDHCRILDTGAGGFHIAGVNSVDDPDTVPHDITVTDCEIGHYGRVYANAVGILLRYAYDSTLAHNEIYDGYYTGISVGWSWGYNPHATHDILVEKNHIHDIGQQLLSDMGGIYTLGLQPGTVLRGNLIHDVKSRTYGGWGIYPDEGSSDILIENNICYEFSEQPFHQHYGENNLVRNNIFAFGAGGIVAVTKMEDHNSFTLEHNILYTRGFPVYTRKPSESNFTDHDNLIYDTRFSTMPRLLSDNITLEQLQAQGRGIGSIVADPGFTDPKNGDFTLPEDSPAYQIGFTPIDMTDVGIR